MERRVPSRARGITHLSGETRAGEQAERLENNLIQLMGHTVDGKEELWISKSPVPRSRPEKLHLVPQTRYLLYIWQLCLGHR